MDVFREKSPKCLESTVPFIENRRKARFKHRKTIFILLTLTIILATAVLIGVFFYEHSEQGRQNNNSTSNRKSENSSLCERRIVGYYDLNSTVDLRDEQLSLLTHIIFWPGNVESDGRFRMGKSHEQYEKFEKLVKRARLFNVKTMFSTNDGVLNSKVFNQVLRDEDRKRNLLYHLTSLVRNLELDGIDLEYRFPETNEEKDNQVALCKELREELNALEPKRSDYIISAVASIDKYLTPNTEIMEYIDFLNIETDYYYGPLYHLGRNILVGPSAPLYGKSPNVDYTMEYYTCLMKNPKKLNMMVTFSGTWWRNVVVPENASETSWMIADSDNGRVDGGWYRWRTFKNSSWSQLPISWNSETRTNFIWKPEEQLYYSFENERSLQEKVEYANEKNIGGITVSDVSYDVDENSLLKAVSSAKKCSGEEVIKYKCD